MFHLYPVEGAHSIEASGSGLVVPLTGAKDAFQVSHKRILGSDTV
jgi:hypothetical protein